MNFKKWLKKNTTYNGVIITFYIPSKKLNKTIRNKLHSFFVKNHEAYTHETSNIKGFWLNKNNLIKDKHERYEVSISKEKKIKELISFISNICKEIEEESIYLTIGKKSYLVRGGIN